MRHDEHMTIETVYLVEDHTKGSDRTYWAHVYLSAGKAKAGVEHWAERGGVGRLRWEEGSFGVLMAYPEANDTDCIYTVVPLGVHQDHQPE
jgi:hypothetical protein